FEDSSKGGSELIDRGFFQASVERDSKARGTWWHAGGSNGTEVETEARRRSRGGDRSIVPTQDDRNDLRLAGRNHNACAGKAESKATREARHLLTTPE